MFYDCLGCSHRNNAKLLIVGSQAGIFNAKTNVKTLVPPVIARGVQSRSALKIVQPAWSRLRYCR